MFVQKLERVREAGGSEPTPLSSQVSGSRAEELCEKAGEAVEEAGLLEGRKKLMPQEQKHREG